MNLCIDVGNTQIHTALYNGESLIAEFRCKTIANKIGETFNQSLQLFLNKNDINPKSIFRIAISSVVPEVDEKVKQACITQLKITPIFLSAQNYMVIKKEHFLPVSLGADRVANFIGATTLFPNENLIIIDLGTATTVCVITKDYKLISGSIMPGLATSAKALNIMTAKLPQVEVKEIEVGIVESTVESIQIGLYYGHLGAIKELISRFKNKFFKDEQVILVATGGFAALYQGEKVFNHIIYDLVLRGLNYYANNILP